jgi:ATP-dependent DNA helicase PIF1
MTTVLNHEQSAALTAVKRGKNIFLTGAGGTGKSHTIRAITSWAANAGICFAVTAMTGCAALLLNYDGAHVKAKTLHSWAGIGLATQKPAELAEIVDKNRRAKRRWLTTQLLIVDEVSMMTPDLLEKLDLIARRIRRQPTAKFGGIQIVFAGDFCQLPPVSRQDIEFVFQSPTWSDLIEETHNLTQIVRQSDPVFQKLLTEARMGSLTPESLAVLESRKGLDWADNEIRPTLLFSRNAEVDKINRLNMDALEGERRTYEPRTVIMEKNTTRQISINDDETQRALAKLDTDAPYDMKLELCVGAQVMLLTNMDQEGGLVNGSRGVVTGYSGGGLPLVRFLGFTEPVLIDRANWWLAEPDNIGRSQIPLKVAYAVTIHKSQGATLDSALVDIGSSTFEYGQAYVALSRCRSLEGLYVWALDPRKIMCHPAVRAFYEALLTVVSEEAEVAESADIWQIKTLSPVWLSVVEPRIDRIQANITALTDEIAPQPADIFNAIRACPDPAAVSVIILGQDPYPTAGNAHGLSFSTRPTVAKIPASLQNIYKELAGDLQVAAPTTGCLQRWADQGVLLLNDVLTVTIGKPFSHAGQGWEVLTAEMIAAVLKAAPHVVVIAWGRPAQKKLEHPAVKPFLANHTVLTAPHPSPLSAHTGFFGSKPFSKTNAALIAHGQLPIEWI